MIILDPEEKIHLITRRHRYALLKLLMPEVLIFLAVIFFMVLLLFMRLPTWPDFLIELFPAVVFVKLRYLLLFLLSLFLQFLWLIIFLTVTSYYFDCWIVTDKRTIHTELRVLFSRILSSVPHNKIQDITIDIHGIFPTIWRFGDLKIQTAGAFREFIFKEIPEPYNAKKIILRAQRELSQRK
jgi:hypothetical protein